MKDYSEMIPETTIGLDLGDRLSYYLVLDGEGKVVREGRVRTQRSSMRALFSVWSGARVVLEVGTHSGWVSHVLQELGHEVVVANPRKLALISANDRKRDRRDGELLARLGRADVQLLSPVRHRGARAHRDLQWIRSRAHLVKLRTELINHVRSTVKGSGGRLPGCSSPSFAAKMREQLPAELFQVLVALLDLIQEVTDKIRFSDGHIRRLSEEVYAETAILRRIQGVGPVTALSFVLTLEDASRFASSRQVGAYLGLCPRLAQSGEKDPQLRISKAGDRALRALLINCAHYILGPFGQDSDLRRHGERIAARGGPNAKKRAVVAVARKLSVVMHHLWRSGEVYEPLYNQARCRAA